MLSITLNKVIGRTAPFSKQFNFSRLCHCGAIQDCYLYFAATILWPVTPELMQMTFLLWIPGYLDSSLSDWNFLLSKRRLQCYDLRRSALYILPPGTVRLVAIVAVSFATVYTQSSVKPFGYFWCITRQLLSTTKIILWNATNISACCYSNAKYLSTNL